MEDLTKGEVGTVVEDTVVSEGLVYEISDENPKALQVWKDTTKSDEIGVWEHGKLVGTKKLRRLVR